MFSILYKNQKARPLNNKMANADTLDDAGVNSGNALDAAKVRQNSETMKFYTDKYPIPGGLHQVTVHAPWPPSPHAPAYSYGLLL